VTILKIILSSKSGYLSFYIACPFLLNYLLTYSMQRRPSLEANMFSASKEITQILWKQKVHHRVFNSPTPVSILSHINLVRPLTPFIFSRSI